MQVPYIIPYIPPFTEFRPEHIQCPSSGRLCCRIGVEVGIYTKKKVPQSEVGSKKMYPKVDLVIHISELAVVLVIGPWAASWGSG